MTPSAIFVLGWPHDTTAKHVDAVHSLQPIGFEFFQCMLGEDDSPFAQDGSQVSLRFDR